MLRISPCLPSPAEGPPSGDGWLHEIKHDGMREIVALPGDHTPALSRRAGCDGEAIVTNDDGLAVFDLIPVTFTRRRVRISACLCARLRGHCVKTAWLDLSLLGPVTALDKGQKSECASGHARGRRRSGALIIKHAAIGMLLRPPIVEVTVS